MDQAEHLRNIIKRQNQQPVSSARVITITSGKGGVGKSNVAVNLAVQLKRMGKEVIIYDADFGLANVEVMFGSVPKYNLSDLIYRGKTVKEIITKGPEGIGFISGGSGISGVNNLSRDQIAFLTHSLRELEYMADVILIDTGAGIADSVLEFVVNSPEVLLVTTPEPSSLTDSYALLKALYRNPNFQKDWEGIRVIANKAVTQEDGEHVFQKLNTVVNRFLDGNLSYLGMIPRDSLMEKAVRQQKPLSLMEPNAKASKAFEQLAERLWNGEAYQSRDKRSFAQMITHLIWKKQ